MSDVESISETKLVSSVQNWFVSYQNSDTKIGLIQDSIIGAFEMTRSSINNIQKFHAMRMCNRTTPIGDIKFDKPTYTSREILSKFLPQINYEATARFYIPDFAPWIKYREDEINVSIKRGEFLTGVLDDDTLGGDSNGSIFHNIYLEKGPYTAITTMYNWQQIFNSFIYYHGITMGFKDIYVNSETRKRIDHQTNKLIAASYDVTRQLDEGKLVPPIEMTLSEYYEEMQSVALEHGDDFIKPIMETIDTNQNWLYKFMVSGSKGARSNMTSIYASIGSIAFKGSRIPLMMQGRTSINFQRYSTDPVSRGYCPNSFTTGISALSFPFAAFEARYELIEEALGTAVAGAMNRNAVKNLESIVIGNTRGSVKAEKIVQLVFGETGVDPRKVEKVQLQFLKMSDEEFATRYGVQQSMLPAKFRNAGITALLAKEFERLQQDRTQLRGILLRQEAGCRKNFTIKDSVRVPINPKREVQNIIELAKESKYKPLELDIPKAVARVAQFIDELGYLCVNDIQRKAKTPLPAHLRHSTLVWGMLIRSACCARNLLANGFDLTMLEQVLDSLTVKLTDCFIEYGTNVGIIAAESISEPITQFLLDSKHSAGIKKEKTNVVDRFDEILKNKTTEELNNPQMILTPLEEYQEDRQKVMEIANHIEMLSLGRFIVSVKLFNEEFGKPTHPDFAQEAKLISKFVALNLGDPAPKDLINWCIRIQLDQEEMILKSMKMKTIYLKLKEQFPHLYIVYTLTGEPILRIYIRSVFFKKGTDISEHNLKTLTNTLRETTIRGVDGVYGATVISINKTSVAKDGSLESKKIFVIETDGTNLSKILENPYINGYESWSTSISEMEDLYGVEVARNKVVDELLNTEKHKANYEWATIYADEMAYSGRITSIQRSGLGQRELNNVLLRASFGSPIQVLQQAAINNQTDVISGMSAPLVLGTIPKFGTTYNDVMIDSQSIEEEDLSEKIDAI